MTPIVLGVPSQFFIAIASLGVMIFYSLQLTIAFLMAFLLIAAVNLLFLPTLQQKTRAQIVLGAILILDESTAALDPIIEAEVLDNIIPQKIPNHNYN